MSVRKGLEKAKGAKRSETKGKKRGNQLGITDGPNRLSIKLKQSRRPTDLYPKI